MIVDRTYKISAFGDFSDIFPTTDNMMFFLENFKDDGLFPSVFQEFKIENSNPQPTTLQRIALVSNDGLESVPIASNRIDYEWKSTEDVKISVERLDEIQGKVSRVFGLIFNKFDKKASRLALNTESLVIDLTDKELLSFLGKFSNPISIYNESGLKEWNTRLMTYKTGQIGNKEELFNVITIISKAILHKNVDNQVVQSEGFSINADINTVAERSVQRFSSDDFSPFINLTTKLWNSIIEELG